MQLELDSEDLLAKLDTLQPGYPLTSPIKDDLMAIAQRIQIAVKELNERLMNTGSYAAAAQE